MPTKRCLSFAFLLNQKRTPQLVDSIMTLVGQMTREEIKTITKYAGTGSFIND